MKLSCLLYVSMLVPCVCLAQPDNENLLQSLPHGYKVDYQARQGKTLMTEMVPKAETVNNWTEMVTTQVFRGLKDATLEEFQESMKKQWLAACGEGEVAPVTKGKENGYAFSIWVQTCPLNSSTGKPENTWFKAIRGNDSFYVIQKAFKFDPSREQVVQWMQYFRSIMVCEPRVLSFSYVLEVLAVLTVVHTARDESARIISFRPASNQEREVYYDWLESQ